MMNVMLGFGRKVLDQCQGTYELDHESTDCVEDALCKKD